MNNSNRNTRTLIVSFLIAIFALIPLRFLEVGQQQSISIQTQVLGEKTEKPIKEVIEFGSGLEAPYAQIEKCYSQKEIDDMEKQVETLLSEINEKKSNICQ